MGGSGKPAPRPQGTAQAPQPAPESADQSVAEPGKPVDNWLQVAAGNAPAPDQGPAPLTPEQAAAVPSQKKAREQELSQRADAVVQTICLGMLVVLTHYGWNLVEGNWGNQLTVLGWPVAIQYMGMAVGSSLMLVFMAWDLWQILAGVPRDQRYPDSE